jgi:hypothetical protein
MATMLSLSILSSSAVYANANPANSRCGMDTTANPPVPCTVLTGQRLTIEHVSGYALFFTSANTTLAVSLLVTDPALGLAGDTFHTFVATKTRLLAARIPSRSPRLSS